MTKNPCFLPTSHPPWNALDNSTDTAWPMTGMPRRESLVPWSSWEARTPGAIPTNFKWSEATGIASEGQFTCCQSPHMLSITQRFHHFQLGNAAAWGIQAPCKSAGGLKALPPHPEAPFFLTLLLWFPLWKDSDSNVSTDHTRKTVRNWNLPEKRLQP